MKNSTYEQSAFQGAGTYAICVQGRLSPGWEDRVAGMRVASDRDPDDQPTTTFTGALRDQAELMGVLNTLYELHLPILSVERSAAGDPPHAP